MKIYKNKDKIAIVFEYSQALVDKVKTLPGRRYNAIRREWNVPEYFAREAVMALEPLGFEIDFSVLNLIKQKEASEIRTDLPLFEYQKEGVKFLMRNKFCFLGDDVGLGKSLMALVACEELGLKRVLVITMTSLKYNFAQEIKKWYPHKKVVVIDGDRKERQKQYKKPADYYIVNYETVRIDIENPFFRERWQIIIADEASKIKNPQAKISKIFRFLNAERKICATGTPIVNIPADLWSPFTWLLPGILDSWWGFRQKYCKLDYWGGVVGYYNLEDLQKRIAPYFLRRTKNEVMKELPEKIYVDIPVEFSDSEKRLYKAIKNEILNEIDLSAVSKIDLGTINSMLTKLVRLQQVADSSELVGKGVGSSKLEALKELLVSLEEKKVVIFTRFKQMAYILARELTEYKPLLVTGDTPTEARMGRIDEFKTGNSKTLISTEVLGFGINLQFCAYVVNFDLPYSISKFEQRIGRIDRIGQRRPMTIYNLIVNNSVDVFVQRILYRKNKTAQEIFEGIRALLS